ncbi:hypothetical protein OH76DRAFT_138194 [Lentinus brumalis]|uniref:Homeobox domain-containing protein n=1 Tax=Lentinus brumalis TaxID=2498619 RepID=A0A371CPJ6_9APHY|nr:hypothetical protein OH76DRAFT_138194 [Polyporus brumalis]
MTLPYPSLVPRRRIPISRPRWLSPNQHRHFECSFELCFWVTIISLKDAINMTRPMFYCHRLVLVVMSSHSRAPSAAGSPPPPPMSSATSHNIFAMSAPSVMVAHSSGQTEAHQPTLSSYPAPGYNNYLPPPSAPSYHNPMVVQIHPAPPPPVIPTLIRPAETTPPPTSSSSSKTKKRKAGPENAKYLTNYYRTNKNPSYEQLLELSNTTGMFVEEIRHWFASKRSNEGATYQASGAQADASGSHEKRQYKKRIKFNDLQVEKLEAAFANNPSPGPAERYQLACELGVDSSEVIFNWFANRRRGKGGYARRASLGEGERSSDVQ